MKSVDHKLLIALEFAALAAIVAVPICTASEGAVNGSFFDSAGTRIHYLDRGAGEAVLLIHGLTLDLEIGWVMTGVVESLADAGFRVVAYDTRGHGKSDRPHDSASYGPVEVEDAIRLLDYLKIKRAHIVGWSRGAFLANRIREWYPDRVKTVTLGGWGESGQTDAAIPEPARSETATILQAADFHTMVRMVIPDSPSSEVEEWAALLKARNDHLALAAVVRAGESWPLLTDVALRDNSTPALAIVGSRDFMWAAVEQMRGLMANLEVLVVPEATHGTTVDRPEFATALVGFLNKHREDDSANSSK